MCFQSDTIEKEAIDMTEKIKQESLYSFVCVVDEDGKEHWDTRGADKLIREVIVKDEDDKRYSVKPNPNGLRFAKGEITYKEYNRLEKVGSNLAFASFIGGVGFLIMVFVSLKNFI